MSYKLPVYSPLERLACRFSPGGMQKAYIIHLEANYSTPDAKASIQMFMGLKTDPPDLFVSLN